MSILESIHTAIVKAQIKLFYWGAKDKGPVFDTENFAWTKELEANWKDIRAELDALLVDYDKLPPIQEVSSMQESLTKDTRWKAFFFRCYGYKMEDNCQECPKTAALLDKVPGINTAFFSILAPKKQIHPHRGPYNGLLRYHLGLKVPDEKLCRIHVSGTTIHWQEGKSYIFDDTYLHYAENLSDEIRVVLIIDFLRPLPWWLHIINVISVKLIRFLPGVAEVKAYHQAKKKKK